MDPAKEIAEIDELFGDGWFATCCEKNEDLARMPLEERVAWLKINSVHGFTDFFRDPELLPILEHVVLPRARRLPLKVASVGCSDGREVYSMLIRFWNRREDLVIHGYDVNPAYIQEARSGGAGIRINSKGYRDSNAYTIRFCDLQKWKEHGAEGGAYTTSPVKNNWTWAYVTMTEEARKRVRFSVHDIVKAPLPETYDAIVIQNVLCHYAPQGRERILANISQSLNPEGWLLGERYNPRSANAAKEYDAFMKDLSSFGFLKQRTIIPTWYSVRTDVSCWTRIYKKMDAVEKKTPHR